jgi:2-hydroxy-6-oxonona-2,4-dienedioate hydrolase
MASEEKIVKINGLNVRFLEAGTANQRALLLVHGGIGDARLHWEPAIGALADDYHVLAPDLPGFGKSDLLPHMQTEAIVQWIKAFLDSQDIQQAVVIGNSFGGLLARLFAATYPAHVPALIMLNGGGVPDMPGFLRAMERVPGIGQGIFYLFGNIGTSAGTLKRMVHDQTLLTDQFLKEVKAARGGYSRLMRTLIGSPMPKAQTPIVPTLILWGADDQIATVKDGEAIKSSIPGAVLTEIKDCGHMPQLETMDVFIWQVNTFLEKLSKASAAARSGPGILPTLPS